MICAAVSSSHYERRTLVSVCCGIFPGKKQCLCRNDSSVLFHLCISEVFFSRKLLRACFSLVFPVWSSCDSVLSSLSPPLLTFVVFLREPRHVLFDSLVSFPLRALSASGFHLSACRAFIFHCYVFIVALSLSSFREDGASFPALHIGKREKVQSRTTFVFPRPYPITQSVFVVSSVPQTCHREFIDHGKSCGFMTTKNSIYQLFWT